MPRITYRGNERVYPNFAVHGWVATLKNKLDGNPTWERLMTDKVKEEYSKQIHKGAQNGDVPENQALAGAEKFDRAQPVIRYGDSDAQRCDTCD